MGSGNVVSDVLLALGSGVIVASCLSALALRNVQERLHALSPVTSLGAPLVGLALAVYNGWGLTTAQMLFIVALLAGAGPVLAAATARASARAGEDGEQGGNAGRSREGFPE